MSPFYGSTSINWTCTYTCPHPEFLIPCSPHIFLIAKCLRLHFAMNSPTNSQPLGSELWTNSDIFEEKCRARIDEFSSKFSQSALLARASHLRGGVGCSLSLKFSAGTVNYVRKITFDDGIEWIARLCMPNIHDKHAFAPDITELKSGVAAAEFLR
jgi:hypothetical protein